MTHTPFETALRPQRALVVHPHSAVGAQPRTGRALLEEAVGLAEAIHLDIIEALLFTLKKATPRTLLGSGQVDHCRELAQEHEIDVIIVNAQLSPTQQRNLETATKCKVIDRTALILEIFGERAQTAEGSLQVELAALNYQKSRLVRSWTHLERQRGGFGFLGGPGESQIETDRRLISDRIILIKQQLEKVVRTRHLHRKNRRETPLPTVALVGYTNAGKSTLFNRLTNAKVLAENMLFATLDPTIRAINLPSGQKALLSDTVGFISYLPHELVAAFRATLEEVIEADILLHVRDISHADSAAQAADVRTVLAELLGKDDTRTHIEVWNKIDQIRPDQTSESFDHTEVALVSALTGEGCQALLATIDRCLMESYYVTQTITLEAADGKSLAWLHAHGTVRTLKSDEDAMQLEVKLRPEDAARFANRRLESS